MSMILDDHENAELAIIAGWTVKTTLKEDASTDTVTLFDPEGVQRARLTDLPFMWRGNPWLMFKDKLPKYGDGLRGDFHVLRRISELLTLCEKRNPILFESIVIGSYQENFGKKSTFSLASTLVMCAMTKARITMLSKIARNSKEFILQKS